MNIDKMVMMIVVMVLKVNGSWDIFLPPGVPLLPLADPMSLSLQL